MTEYSTVAEFAAATVLLSDDTMVYIQNYYAGVDGGGHWCRIKSSAPAHPLYHTSANGKYAVLAELNPNALQLGCQPYGVTADCTPAYNAWLKYCAAGLGCSSLHWPSGNWTFATRPDPIFTQGLPYGRTITGDGVQSTIFYTSYQAADIYGFFHLLPNGNGGGLEIKDCQIISTRTDFTGGCAIAAHDGYVTKLVAGGTIHAGDVLTVTVNGTAVTYTVAPGDTLQNIVAFVAMLINGNSTIYNSYVMAIPCDDTAVVISKASSPATITVGSSGTTTLTRTTVGQQTAGYIVLQNLNITAHNGWSYTVLFDGMREDVSPSLGIRSIFGDNCNFFGGHYASVALWGCVGFQFTNSTVVVAGGASGTLSISGLSGFKSQNFYWSGGAINDLSLDQAAFGTIAVGKILGDALNTGNTDGIKILAGSIAGAKSTNWTNSAYL